MLVADFPCWTWAETARSGGGRHGSWRGAVGDNRARLRDVAIEHLETLGNKNRSGRLRPDEFGTNALLNEGHASRLEIEHVVEGEVFAACPAGLKTDQELRQGLVEGGFGVAVDG